jgi:hypothetical protein
MVAICSSNLLRSLSTKQHYNPAECTQQTICKKELRDMFQETNEQIRATDNLTTMKTMKIIPYSSRYIIFIMTIVHNSLNFLDKSWNQNIFSKEHLKA